MKSSWSNPNIINYLCWVLVKWLSINEVAIHTQTLTQDVLKKEKQLLTTAVLVNRLEQATDRSASSTTATTPAIADVEAINAVGDIL